MSDPTSMSAKQSTLVDLTGLAHPLVCDVFQPICARMPEPVERSKVIAAIAKLASGQAELGRYLVEGPFTDSFAFQEEVAGMVAEGLRQILEVEAARVDALPEPDELCSPDEREVLGQLLGAIARFQEEWGRG